MGLQEGILKLCSVRELAIYEMEVVVVVPSSMTTSASEFRRRESNEVVLTGFVKECCQNHISTSCDWICLCDLFSTVHTYFLFSTLVFAYHVYAHRICGLVSLVALVAVFLAVDLLYVICRRMFPFVSTTSRFLLERYPKSSCQFVGQVCHAA